MAVTTQAVVQNVARLLGGFQAVTATGSGTSTTVVDTNLKNYVNDSFASWWLRATSGTNDGEERRVKSLVQSTGTLTVEPPSRRPRTPPTRLNCTRCFPLLG